MTIDTKLSAQEMVAVENAVNLQNAKKHCGKWTYRKSGIGQG